MTDLKTLFDQINALLADPRANDLAHLEHTLTDGYACALSLEAERWRLARRMNELAGEVGSGGVTTAKELSAVARRLESSNDDLSALRSLLATLRTRTDAVREATA